MPKLYYDDTWRRWLMVKTVQRLMLVASWLTVGSLAMGQQPNSQTQQRQQPGQQTQQGQQSNPNQQGQHPGQQTPQGHQQNPQTQQRQQTSPPTQQGQQPNPQTQQRQQPPAPAPPKPPQTTSNSIVETYSAAVMSPTRQVETRT